MGTQANWTCKRCGKINIYDIDDDDLGKRIIIGCPCGARFFAKIDQDGRIMPYIPALQVWYGVTDLFGRKKQR